MKRRFWPCLLALLLIGANAAAVELHTEHTFKLAEGEPPPTASLEDAAWLTGRAGPEPPSASAWIVMREGDTVSEHKLEYVRSGAADAAAG